MGIIDLVIDFYFYLWIYKIKLNEMIFKNGILIINSCLEKFKCI